MTRMPVRSADAVIRASAAHEQFWSRPDTALLTAILGLALFLRCLFFTGFFGSDEVTYVESAARIVRGDWSGSDYIGAIRYGVNLPIALSFALFGVSEFSGNLWSLLTSLAEVALVYYGARHMWGSRAAVAAAVCLAVLPVHAHYATRLMADAPLALFVSLFFVAAWMAEQRGTRPAYLVAGCAIGATFWIKDAVFYLSIAVLGVYVVLARRWHRKWLLTAGGALALVALNGALMWALYGNPLYSYVVTARSLGALPAVVTTPSFYLHYLLLDVKHTFLLGFLVLGAIVASLRRQGIAGLTARPEGYVMIWGGVFVVILSMLSLRQVNYMLIFTGPFAMLAGYFLSTLSRAPRVLLLAVIVGGGVALTALEQQAVQSFTANSRATVQFADAHPDAEVFSSEGATRADTYRRTIDPHPVQRQGIRGLSELDALLTQPASAASAPVAARALFAVDDPQMHNWAVTKAGQTPARASSPCLMQTATLTPAALGSGRHVVNAMLALAAQLPDSSATPVTRKLESSFRPQSAVVYAVGAPCWAPDPQHHEANKP